MKKFELTTDSKIFCGKKLFRIKALVSFDVVRKGDVGGYVESENNLSDEGNAWVYKNAHVYGNARVYGNAWVCENAQVYGNAHVYGDARVYGDAQVYDNARVYGDAQVYDNARVYGDAQVYDNALVYDNARVYGDAWVYENACVSGDARVCGNAWVCENACVSGDARVSGDADYATIKGFGSENRNTTFFKINDGGVGVKCGYFSGNLADFRSKVKETHGESKIAREYLLIADLMGLHFKDAERENG